MMTLYGNPDSFRVQKVLAAAKYAGVNLKIVDAEPPKDSAFPLRPLLVDGATELFGSNAIAQHVAGVSLRAQNNDAAQMTAWLDVSESRFLPLVLGLVLPATSVMHHDKKATESELGVLVDLLDHYLVSRTFLVGQRVSLADLALAFNLSPAFIHVLDASFRGKYENVTRWYKTIMQQPNVMAVVGPLKLCDKPAQFNAKQFKELSSAAESSNTSQQQTTSEYNCEEPPETHSKKRKGKKDKKKKEEAKPEPEELDAADAALAAEPKQKDPFAAFPKSNFNMDEFKRVYSNEDTVTKALPYFWEHFDADNYTIWYCEYKYPKELTQIFMSCNLINGMYQRLEKLRKNAFASMALFGTDNNSTISGVWFWKGPELAFTLSPDWQIDYESYEWKKLDSKDPKTKTLVNEYFAWEGNFDGKKFNQGKIFK